LRERDAAWPLPTGDIVANYFRGVGQAEHETGKRDRNDDDAKPPRR